MSRQVFLSVQGHLSRFSRSALVAVSLLGTAQFAQASQAGDQLSDCLVKATTATDKTTVLQWTFAALSALIYAELSGDFPLGDSKQPTYKSLRPFDLVS